VVAVHSAWSGGVPTAIVDAATEAGALARREVGTQVRSLLEADVDDQRATPLSLLRAAVRYPSAVLAAAGVPPVERDEYAAGQFPDDSYDLTPATWTDVDPSLHEPGLAWSAAKAWTHKRRHTPAGPAGTTPATVVVAVVHDLMDRSKLAAAVAGTRFVATEAALAEALSGLDPTRATVVVDLRLHVAFSAIVRSRAEGIRVIAYGSHVDRETLARARAAGCERVLARSAFFAGLPGSVG
jgi:hypothetical protein